MRKLQNTTATDEVLLADKVFALALPPPVFGVVPAAWNDFDFGGACVPEIDIELWANATVGLTSAELFTGSLHPIPLAIDLDASAVDATDNEWDFGAPHTLLTGDGPFDISSAGTLAGGLSATVPVWIIRVDADSVSFADSFVHALAGTEINISSTGSGTQSIASNADTKRLHWHSNGLLGPAGDGAVSLTSQLGYRTTIAHRSRNVAYAVAASLSASDPEWVSISMWPTQDR